MEEASRRNDTPPVPGRGFTISPAIDADLRNRIRSLLLSRNRQRPPGTPSPSPDYNYSPIDPDENRLGYSPIHTETYRFSPNQAIAKLTRLRPGISDMGATRFDGPAGQIEDDTDTPRRRPSQPGTQDELSAIAQWTWSRPAAGLDQPTRGELVGKEFSTSNSLARAKSAASSKSTGSRIPRFALRIVSPANAQVADRRARPNAQHVPGSYTSSPVASPALEEIPKPKHSDMVNAQICFGVNSEEYSSAVDALQKAATQDPRAFDSSVSVLKERSSNTTPQSATPIEQSHRPLLKPFESLYSVSQIAQPILSPDDYGNSHDDTLETPILVAEEDHNVEETRVPKLLDERPESSTQPGSPQLSDLLDQLPPVRQTFSDEVADRYLTTKPSEDFEETLSPSKFSPSVHSLQSIPLDADEAPVSPESPLLPKPLALPMRVNDVHQGHTELDIDDLQARENRRSSYSNPKVSPVSRALSMLSEISSRSGIRTPSLHLVTKRKLSDSPATSNLTARPLHHFKRAAEEAERLRANTMPGRKGYTTLSSDDQLRRHSATESSNGTLALRQQQKNGESFSNVIVNLESLLKEALTIAGQAADKGHTETAPPSPQKQNNADSRINYGEAGYSSATSSSISGHIGEEDNNTTVPHHRGEHVLVIEPDTDARYHGNFRKVRDATPYPAQTRQPSTVPDFDGEEPELKRQGTHRELLEVPGISSRVLDPTLEPKLHTAIDSTDWATIRSSPPPFKPYLKVSLPPPTPQVPPALQAPASEHHAFLTRAHGASQDTGSLDVAHEYVYAGHRPPIQPRQSSMRLKGRRPKPEELNLPDMKSSEEESDCECVPYVADFKTSELHYHPISQQAIGGDSTQATRPASQGFRPREDTLKSLEARHHKSRNHEPSRKSQKSAQNAAQSDYTLIDRHHFSIHEPHDFSLSRSHRRAPIARDWSTSRKRFVATVTCITTAFMGLIIGIYAGEVPAIQYAIADEHHYVILGNVLFFIGLAITTALFWPLPLLHGRKPYTLAALAILLPLQFPQALAINSNRSPYVATYRIGLLLPRLFAGIVMGFANINFKTTLLDLFGASLQSGNPHQETVNENDVRRHGGGMGVWLGIWTWCAIGSIGVGFLIGAGIISGLDVSWGFWITIILNSAVLVLNILVPEVRRSAYRRSMAEVRTGTDVSRRVARGEIKMHLDSTGPIWWWEEVIAGHILCVRMLVQPGFLVLSCYLGWIYGQIVIIIIVSLAQLYGMLTAYSVIALGLLAVQVLSLPSPIRWTFSGNNTPWSSICNTLPESVLVQSSKTPSSKD